MDTGYISLPQATGVLRRTRKYVWSLIRSGDLRREGSGSSTRVYDEDVRRAKEILDSSVNLVELLRQNQLRDEYRRFAGDKGVVQRVHPLGLSLLVRREDEELLLKRLRYLKEEESIKTGEKRATVRKVRDTESRRNMGKISKLVEHLGDIESDMDRRTATRLTLGALEEVYRELGRYKEYKEIIECDGEQPS